MMRNEKFTAINLRYGFIGLDSCFFGYSLLYSFSMRIMVWIIHCVSLDLNFEKCIALKAIDFLFRCLC